MKELIQKLKFNSDRETHLIQLPDTFKKTFEKFSGKGLKPAQVICFVANTIQLIEVIKKIKPILGPDTLFWIAYPKGTAKVKTDITRDKGWESLHKLGWEGMSIISLNDTWSALRFKPSDTIQRQTIQSEVHSFIDLENRIIHKLPEDLEKALKKSKLTTVFHNLSYTQQKEYIISILEAKKEETRQRRLVSIIQKLQS